MSTQNSSESKKQNRSLKLIADMLGIPEIKLRFHQDTIANYTPDAYWWALVDKLRNGRITKSEFGALMRRVGVIPV